MALISHATEEIFKKFFNDIKLFWEECTLTTLKIDYSMCDGELAIRKALRNCFALSDDEILMCYFHVMMNARKLAPLRLRTKVSDDVRSLHMTSSKTEFDAQWAIIKSKWMNVDPRFVRTIFL